MKKLYFILIGVTILIVLIAAFIVSPLNNGVSVFEWQKEKYCPFENEIISFETRCGFTVVTSSDDYSPSNPLWYVRQTDKDFSKDKEISSLDVSMYIQAGKTFPTSQEDVKTYWLEATKYRPYQLQPVIEAVSIGGKKAWKIMESIDGDVPDHAHFSSTQGGFLIERDQKSIYTIAVMATSDSSAKVQTYLKESNHIIDSIVLK